MAANPSGQSKLVRYAIVFVPAFALYFLVAYVADTMGIPATTGRSVAIGAFVGIAGAWVGLFGGDSPMDDE